MTEPTVGLWHDARHQYYAAYEDIGKVGPLPGVTGAIGMKDKPAIVGWAKNEVAKAAIANYEMLGQMVGTGGADAAAKWLSAIPGYQRDTAADTGSLVHILVEKILRQQEAEVPPELVPYTAAFRRFLETGVKVVAVEKQVANLDVGYGGTLDLLLDFGHGIELWDVKTWRKRPTPGRDMYAETAMQLAAYSRAGFMGQRNDPKRYRMPPITGHGVLHLRPDAYDAGYQLYPFDITDAEFRAFTGLLEVYRWQRDRATKVIGEPPSLRPQPEPFTPTEQAA